MSDTLVPAPAPSSPEPPPRPLTANVSGVAIAVLAVGLLLTVSPVAAFVLPEAVAVIFLLPFVGLWLTQVAKRHLLATGRPDVAARLAAPAELVMRTQMRLALVAAPILLLVVLLDVSAPYG